MEAMRSLSVFKKNTKLTKQEKIEYGLIFLTGLLIVGFGIYMFMPVFAAGNAGGGAGGDNHIQASDIADLLETIVKAICYICGALYEIIGIVKFAISHANEDGPAQQKGIMMIATGILLVVIGTALSTLISSNSSWFDIK